MLFFNDFFFKLIKIIYLLFFYFLIISSSNFSEPSSSSSSSSSSSLNYYISNNGDNNLDCGSLSKPCLDLIYLFNSNILSKENNVSIYFFPGLYNHSETINVTNFKNGFNMIGIDGRENTIITTKPSVRGFLLINSTVNVIGISFQNIYISRNSIPPYIPTGIISDQIYSNYLVRIYFTGAGGAFQSVYCNLSFNNCTFSHNRARNGGALFTVASNSTIRNSIFSFNTAVLRNGRGGNGGAVALGPLSVSNFYRNRFYNNKGTNGGSIIQTNSVLYDYESVYYYNIAQYGGVSLIFNSSVYFAFKNNYLYNFGNISGVSNLDGSSALYSNCKFIGNKGNLYGGIWTMVDESYLYVTTSILENNYSPSAAIVENHGLKAAIFINNQISFTDSYKTHGVIQSVFSLSNFNYLQIKDSTITNITGTIIWCNSNAIVSLYNVVFKEISSKIVNIHSQGFLFSTSCTFINNNAKDYMIVLRNGASSIIGRNTFINNTASTIIFNTYNSSVLLIESRFFDNIVREEIIVSLKGYNLNIQNTMFKGNIGLSRGCVVYTDQWGVLKSYNNYYINNTGIFGTIFYFSDGENIWYTEMKSMFKNDTIQSNKAKSSGAIVYYPYEVKINYTCQNCLIENNEATYGDNINSNYYSFYVLQVSTVQSNVEFPSIIYAYDHFGNLIKGRNDIVFTVTPQCLGSNISLDGIKGSVIQTNGITTLYNLRVNQIPGTKCNLTYDSLPMEPEPGSINKSITIQNCPCDTEIFNVGNDIYECLTVKNISRIAKIIICVITGLAVIFSFICLTITIVYINEKVINFGNIVFLIVIIIACLLFCLTIFLSVKVSKLTCILSTVFLPIAFGLLFIMVLLKQLKIYKLFRYSDFLKINADNLEMIKYGSILMVPIAIFLIIGLIAFPIRPKYLINLQYKTATHVCYSSKWYIFSIVISAYDLILLIVSCVISIKSIRYHSTPGTFYESLFNSLLIYNYSLIFVVLLPLVYVFQNNPTVGFLVISIGSLVIVVVTLFIVFLPKFNFLFRRKKIVSSLRKVIETQEREIERNKDLLIFYKMFLIDKNNLDNPIFNIHETFSSDEEYQDKIHMEENYVGSNLKNLKKEYKRRKKRYKNQFKKNQENHDSNLKISQNSNSFNNSNNIKSFNISTPTLYEINLRKNKKKDEILNNNKSKSMNNSPNISDKNLKRRKSNI